MKTRTPIALAHRLSTIKNADLILVMRDGDVIASSYNEELAALRKLRDDTGEFLLQMEAREREATGIPTLRVEFYMVQGCYIEVTKSYAGKVPIHYHRRQTLKNVERFITPELKSFEDKALSAKERTAQLEKTLYEELVGLLKPQVEALMAAAHALAALDVLAALARHARERRWVRPERCARPGINIRGGRHPVVETTLEVYVPNDCRLEDGRRMLVITGPNMGGKSTYMRSVALIVLLAWAGSFVPADAAQLGPVDRIHTRIGASDDLAHGRSTFKVEMTEAAAILSQATDRSLVLMDEIGRGTSTYDGISIAWAMVEYLHNHQTAHAKTLFATHYHELNEMEQMCPRVKNYHVSVKELGNQIVFLRKLERGGTEHSFGIHVARMAGMPMSVVSRADEILRNLELVYGNNEIVPSRSLKSRGKKPSPSVREAAEAGAPQNMQLSMFQLDDPVLVQIRDQIKGLDINSLTPIEALNKLIEIKKITGI